METLLIIVLACFCVTIQLEPIQATGCRNGWIRFENSCYYFSKEADTWPEASTICVDLHSHLATAGSADENSFMKSEARRLGAKAYWLAGTDFEIEDVWRWTTSGDKFTFTDWQSNEPNAGTGANCLVLWRDHNYQWADDGCRHVWNFICEMSVTGAGEQVIG